MIALHTSDWHGRHKALLDVLDTQEYDVWFDTGDLQPNPGWNSPIKRVPQVQARQQINWWAYKGLAHKIKDVLRGRPAVMVPGNHDFFNHAAMLAHRYSNFFAPGLDPVDVDGLRVCGISEIPYIAGFWAREARREQLAALVSAIPKCDVLLSHAPPAGFLSWCDDWGIAGLEKVEAKAIFFGHVHECGGGMYELDGKVLYNSATTFQLVEIS